MTAPGLDEAWTSLAGCAFGNPSDHLLRFSIRNNVKTINQPETNNQEPHKGARPRWCCTNPGQGDACCHIAQDPPGSPPKPQLWSGLPSAQDEGFVCTATATSLPCRAWLTASWQSYLQLGDVSGRAGNRLINACEAR